MPASGDSGVGIHFNGACLQQTSIFESEFFDVERVEVLRGSQGTLYGRNTTGGVLNIIPAKPADELEASIDGQLGNHDNMKFQGMVNVPVSEMLQLRLSGMMLDRDGYTDNLFTDEKVERDLRAQRAGAHRRQRYPDHAVRPDRLRLQLPVRLRHFRVSG